MKHIRKICLCVAIAFFAAMAMTIVMHFAYWPPRWKKIEFDFLIGIAGIGAMYIAAVPLLVLSIVSLRRVPSTFLSATISCAWLFLIFLFRAKKPWLYYGDFPWWMLQRDFIQLLPGALAVGLAFGVSARVALGPNNSFKPTPHRGVGHVPTLR